MAMESVSDGNFNISNQLRHFFELIGERAMLHSLRSDCLRKVELENLHGGPARGPLCMDVA